MAYLMIRSQDRGLGVRRMVCLVEQAILHWLNGGDPGSKETWYPGIWVGTDKFVPLDFILDEGSVCMVLRSISAHASMAMI